MDRAERYRAAVTTAFGTVHDDVSLLPEVMARACVQVLPVEGAGISVTQGTGPRPTSSAAARPGTRWRPRCR